MPVATTQTPAGTYCGTKKNLPLGSPSFCYRKGLRVGFAAASRTAEEKARKAKISGIMMGSTAQRKDIRERLRTGALAFLKRDVSLAELKADEIRSIVARLHQRGQTWTGPGSHTNASKAAMTQWLKTRGWHD